MMAGLMIFAAFHVLRRAFRPLWIMRSDQQWLKYPLSRLLVDSGRPNLSIYLPKLPRQALGILV